MDNLLNESPYSSANRLLQDEPLNVEDWEQAHDAYRAFLAQVRMIVVRARKRGDQPAEARREAERADVVRVLNSVEQHLGTVRYPDGRDLTVLSEVRELITRLDSGRAGEVGDRR